MNLTNDLLHKIYMLTLSCLQGSQPLIIKSKEVSARKSQVMIMMLSSQLRVALIVDILKLLAQSHVEHTDYTLAYFLGQYVRMHTSISAMVTTGLQIMEKLKFLQ